MDDRSEATPLVPPVAQGDEGGEHGNGVRGAA